MLLFTENKRCKRQNLFNKKKMHILLPLFCQPSVILSNLVNIPLYNTQEVSMCTLIFEYISCQKANNKNGTSWEILFLGALRQTNYKKTLQHQTKHHRNKSSFHQKFSSPCLKYTTRKIHVDYKICLSKVYCVETEN